MMIKRPDTEFHPVDRCSASLPCFYCGDPTFQEQQVLSPRQLQTATSWGINDDEAYSLSNWWVTTCDNCHELLKRNRSFFLNTRRALIYRIASFNKQRLETDLAAGRQTKNATSLSELASLTRCVEHQPVYTAVDFTCLKLIAPFLLKPGTVSYLSIMKQKQMAITGLHRNTTKHTSSTVHKRRTCKHCGQFYIVRQGKERYCDRKCVNAAYYRRRKKLNAKTSTTSPVTQR